MNNKQVNLIGISGRIGSGKDTFAQILIDQLGEGWEIKKYAQKLKQIASILTGVPVENFEDQVFKACFMGGEWGQMTFREFLQRLGTEAVRNNIHTNAWVNAFYADFKERFTGNILNERQLANEKFWHFPKWIVTDVRFQNEADEIKKRGGIVVRISRNETTGENLHSSETALDDYPFDDFIRNTGTLAELEILAKIFITKYGLK